MMTLSLDSLPRRAGLRSTSTMREIDGDEVQLVSGGDCDGSYVTPTIGNINIDYSVLYDTLIGAGLVDAATAPTPPPDIPCVDVPPDIQIPTIEIFIGYIEGIDGAYSWDMFLLNFYNQSFPPMPIIVPSPQPSPDNPWEDDECP